MSLRKWLEIEYLKDIPLDDPRTTDLRRRVLKENRFVNRIYREWYALISAAVPGGPGAMLELGSGAGFLHEHLPGLIQTEVFSLRDVDVQMDGQYLPFAGESVRAIAMTNVLHHIPSARKFFAEAQRVLRPGGVVAMIEPWNSTWSRFIYTHLHHEPFVPGAPDWDFPSSGPLSGANGALPWMIFERDAALFAREFPHLRIRQVRLLMPFLYLVSGGVSMRSILPYGSYGLVAGVESLLGPLLPRTAMFAHIVVQKVGHANASRMG